MKKIRLALVIDTVATNAAGTEQQLLKVVQGLDKGRFEVELLCLRRHAWLDAHAGTVGCPVTVFDVGSMRRLKTIGSFLELARYMRKSRFDVVHTFFPVANILGVLAARLAGVCAIVSSRRDYGEWMTGPYLAATRLANRFVTRVLTNGSRVKELTVRVEGIKPELVEVIRNGIDVAKYAGYPPDAGLRTRLGVSATSKLVGKVANFRPMKHHAVLVRAAAEVLRARDDVDFLLIGATTADAEGTRLRDEVVALARELGVEGRIHLVGGQSDVRPFLSIMDVGVNCSEGEGLSNAIMEYMASGVACVVSDSGGNPDLVEDRQTGRLFALDDHKALAGILLEMLENNALRRDLADRARRRLEQEMGMEVMLRRFRGFYEGVLGGPASWSA